MRGSELLDKLALVDAAYIMEADRIPMSNYRPWLKWCSAAVCLALLTAALLLPSRITPTPTPDTVSPLPPITEAPPLTTAPLPSDTTVIPPARTHGELDAIIDGAAQKLGIGGGSTLFDREYLDETYNLAELRPPQGGTPLIDEDVLNRWVEEVFLKRSPAEQNALPTLYQAVRDLGIKQEDFLAVNAEWRAIGESMGYRTALDDTVIEALYLPEDEMRQALIHPLALWYAGEIYTWNTLQDDTVSAAIPIDVLNGYVTGVIEICIAEGWLTERDIPRILDKSAP